MLLLNHIIISIKEVLKLNRNDLMSKNRILVTDYEDIKKGEDKFYHHRSNTFLYNNYFENI